MKKNIISIFLVLAAAAYSSALAQPPTGGSTPGGASDNNLRDDNIRMRSVELDRIKKEAAKQDPTKFAATNSKIESKFPEIQEDFEGIQIAQTAIITAYTTGKTIDYKLIASSAKEISKRAKRLDSNLFLVVFDVGAAKTDKTAEAKKPTIRDMIVELDNSIGDFVTSKIFSNLKVFDPEVAKKTRIDLAHVIQASNAVAIVSESMP